MLSDVSICIFKNVLNNWYNNLNKNNSYEEE